MSCRYAERVECIIGNREEQVIGVGWKANSRWHVLLALKRGPRGRPLWENSRKAVRELLARYGADCICQVYQVLSPLDHAGELGELLKGSARKSSRPSPVFVPGRGVPLKLAPPSVVRQSRRRWRHRLGNAITWRDRLAQPGQS